MHSHVVAVLATANEVGGRGDAITSPDISLHIIAPAVNNIHEFIVHRMLVAVLNSTEKPIQASSPQLSQPLPLHL